jgi:exodeoxyribonuclease V beta subunit
MSGTAKENETESFDVLTAPLGVPTLIEASAGTGKTFSIKHLVLRLVVEEGFSIDRILVVTFTKAATAELSSRIRQHIADADDYLKGTLPAGDVDGILVEQAKRWEEQGIAREEVLRRLGDALARFDSAPIYTIHSFCEKSLRSRAFSASDNFDFDLAESDADFRRTAIEDFERRELDRLQGADPAFLEKLLDADAWDTVLQQLSANPASLAKRVLQSEGEEKAVLERFCREAPAELRALKRQARVRSFDDLLADMYERLTSGATAESFAEAVRGLYDAVLIDEFQDTDPLQFAIFRKLFLEGKAAGKKRSVFFVGDPKQAIYRFRSADLNTYLAARRLIGNTKRLPVNYRSTPRLVQAVNAFFTTGSVLSPFLRSDMTFSPVDSVPTRTGLYRLSESGWSEVPPLEIWQTVRPFENAGDRHEASRRALANDIARVLAEGREGRLCLKAEEGEDAIAEMKTVAGGEEKTLRLRPVEARDIAVLVRNHSDAEDLMPALQALGIRARAVSRDDVFKTEEAAEILLMLRAMNRPGDERLVRAARITRIVGDTETTLENDTEERRTQMRALFENARARWARSGAAAGFAGIFEECRTTERLLPEAGGEQRLTNYAHVIELLHAEGRSFATPAGLLARFEKAIAEAGETPEERIVRLASDANLVSVVTIHSSKGLQYPIVYLPFCEKLGSGKTKKSLVFRTVENGVPELLLSLEPQDPPKSFAKENAQEATRLAYVAMTRAKARLVMSFSMHQRSKKMPDAWHANCKKNAYFSILTGEEESKNIADQTIKDRFEDLARENPGCVALRSIADVAADVPPMLTADEKEESLSVSPSRDVLPAWRTSSFTGIARLISDDGGDEGGCFAPARKPGKSADMLDFPRGTRAGTALHEILEKADFQKMAEESAEPDRLALAHEVLSANMAFASEEDAALAEEAASRMIADVLNSEILPGVRLKDVTPEKRCAEMEFLLKTGSGVTAEGLGAKLAELGYPQPPLESEALEGFLTGFIDLAFEADGRFWVLDWKSNAIAESVREPKDYTQPTMAAEMDRHHYRLQYLLYLVALRRFLRARLGDAWRDDLLGGAVYVFLRGVRAEAKRNARGLQGVVLDRVDPKKIAALDDYLRGEEK